MDQFDARADAPTTARLDESEVEAIHEASMRIIEEVGIQLNHERALAVVADNGGTVKANDVVTLPRDVVEDAIARAPSQFTLRARNPEHDVTVGGDGPPVRAPGYGPSVVHRFGDGRRDATLDDYETLVRLAQVSDVITCAGYNHCEPTDVSRDERHVAMLDRVLRLTDKPVMGPTHGAEQAQACMDMVGIALEDPDLSEPAVAGLINTVPPRRIGESMLGGLLTYAEYGQPLVVSSFTMAGASGPTTLAASMAQANAENLVGIALAQFVNPGTPVVYGVPSANIDDRYGSLSIGSPESALFVAFAGQLARFYDLPCRGGGALSDAKAVDYQSGFESAFLSTVTAMYGVDFVLNAAGILESYSAVSPEKFVLDCELLRSLDRFQRGVSIADATIPVDQFAETPPGGHFLDEPERPGEEGAFHRSTVVDKRSHEDWAANGRESTEELANDRVRAMLDAYDRPPMAADVDRALATYVRTGRAATE